MRMRMRMRMIMRKMEWKMIRWRMMMLRKMRWRMMMLRRGKVMRLRVMMWRTDPKTASHNLYEPVQSKCTRASHKSHFIRNLQEKGYTPQRLASRCARACAVEIQMDMPEQPFYARIHLKKEMSRPRVWLHIVRKPAQSKCTWTCQNSHFMREITEKITRPRS